MAGPTHHQMPDPAFDAPVKLLAVASPYYKDIYDQLTAGARAAAERCGATLDVVDVPGALEVPTAIGIAERMRDYHGYVALGCVIRGETTHYETVCNDSSRALQLLGLQGLCIGNGILTVENYDQAAVRAQADGQNKGGGAALAALHLIAISRTWGPQEKGMGFTRTLFAKGGDTV